MRGSADLRSSMPPLTLTLYPVKNGEGGVNTAFCPTSEIDARSRARRSNFGVKTMATKQTGNLARFMLAPSVLLLFVWMIVPLAFTLWFSFQQYNPLNPIRDGFIGFSNYMLFFNNPAFRLRSSTRC